MVVSCGNMNALNVLSLDHKEHAYGFIHESADAGVVNDVQSANADPLMPTANESKRGDNGVIGDNHDGAIVPSLLPVLISAESSSSVGSNCSSLSSKNGSKRKRVHFSNELVDEAQEAATQVLTLEDVAALWYHEEDARRLKKRAKRVAKVYVDSEASPKSNANSNGSHYLTRFRQTIAMCEGTGGEETGETKSKSSPTSLMRQAPLLSNSPDRGLEAYIFPQFFVQRRRSICRAVVRASTTQGSIPPAVVSYRLSRVRRRLARLMAVGDARAVAGILAEDEKAPSLNNSEQA